MDLEVPISLATLALGDAATITTSNEVVTTHFVWYGTSTFGNGSGSGNLTTKGSLALSGGAKVLNGSSILNYGDATWSDGDILLSNGASLYNLKNSAFSIYNDYLLLFLFLFLSVMPSQVFTLTPSCISSAARRRAAGSNPSIRATDNVASTLQNSGTFIIAQNSDVLVPILNLGQFLVAKDCRFGLSSYSQRGDASETKIDGGTLMGNSVAINQGTVRGSGTVSTVVFWGEEMFLSFIFCFSFICFYISASFTNNGTCSVEGPLLIDGSFVQTKDARLVLTIYGNSSLLTITGSATLGGVLEIMYVTSRKRREEKKKEG